MRVIANSSGLARWSVITDSSQVFPDVIAGRVVSALLRRS